MELLPWHATKKNGIDSAVGKEITAQQHQRLPGCTFQMMRTIREIRTLTLERGAYYAEMLSHRYLQAPRVSQCVAAETVNDNMFQITSVPQ